MEILRTHSVTLTCEPLRLRPMTEGDWPILMRWNNGPDVLYFAEGDEVTFRTLDETQDIYRSVSRNAFVFIAELDGEPIGECWLQEMNLKRVIDRYPNLLLMRIDLAIGEKRFWGRGWGTKIVCLLTQFGFEDQSADAIFGCDIADYNPRSRRAFEKNGYTVDAEVVQPLGRKSRVDFDLILTRDEYRRRKNSTSAAGDGRADIS